MPPITGAGCSKAHALEVAKDDARAALGARSRARQEAGSRRGARKPPSIPRQSAASIHLEAVRDQAAAWLPPGFAYAEAAIDAEPAGEIAAEEPGSDAADDPEPVEAGEDAESDDIPAFLTGDVPEGVRPNGAAVS